MAMTNIFAKPATQENNADRLMDDGARAGRGAPRPNPEVVGRAKRRRFTAAYKLKVLAGADAGKGSGEIGALLRREGLYSSHLTKWRQERKAGILQGLTPQKRGPKSKVNAGTGENQTLRRENERLTEQLRRAELVIDVQNKVAMLLGLPLREAEQL
jgi:transposase